MPHDCHRKRRSDLKADCLCECLDCLVVLFLRKKFVPLFLELDRLVLHGARSHGGDRR